ncbi:hypothetical protein D187_001251 [Cystobacter fuscus DSM 2262]|uniref:Uncharacterized protein n=1 Tax=Cystobacter fuscus (strain ATCC 25194 / DSM 2262 / NBRC 100088 / M29) TaxID=1242864 RepID=S9QXS4_CYSF2|nr:hypothetical protein D187_001251 [Cystobacter fuscus DSM 2262]
MNFYLLDTMGEPDGELCLLDDFVEGIDRRRTGSAYPACPGLPP